MKELDLYMEGFSIWFRVRILKFLRGFLVIKLKKIGKKGRNVFFLEVVSEEEVEENEEESEEVSIWIRVRILKFLRRFLEIKLKKIGKKGSNVFFFFGVVSEEEVEEDE